MFGAKLRFYLESTKKNEIIFCQSKIVYHICRIQRPSCSPKICENGTMNQKLHQNLVVSQKTLIFAAKINI